MTLLSIGDAQLYTELQGTGEPLLLVSGLGGTAGFWDKQVDSLAQHYQVIRHDHRNIGRSSSAPLLDSTAAMAKDVLALMDALGIESATIVGHSTGGVIGQHLALDSPKRVKKLVLSASWGGPSPLFVDTFALRRQVLLLAGVRQYQLLGSLLAMPGAHLGESYDNSPGFIAQREKQFPGIDIELARLHAVVSHDLRDRLAEIRVPTHVISARDDALTPLVLSNELADRIPGATQHVLPQGGHFCPVTESQTYNQTLLNLLGHAV